MALTEMVKRIIAGDKSEELINALIEFKWETDPYGVMDAYGHIDDEGVREQMRDEIVYMLDNDPVTLVLEVEEE